MRLQKYMALCGVASRRKSEELIKTGHVKVNDILVLEMGFSVDENIDVIKVDNNIISKDEKKLYFAFNKPRRVITSSKDEKNRKCVLDYFTNIDARVYTVGRLDYDSSGLILVTNDGEFANRVTHPKYMSQKTYDVKISGHISKDMVSKLKSGIIIDGYKTSPAKIKLEQISANSQNMEIIIREGRNRQIRKMVEFAGAKVDLLVRTSVGPIQLGNLKLGEYRLLSESEVEYFYSLHPQQKLDVR